MTAERDMSLGEQLYIIHVYSLYCRSFRIWSRIFVPVLQFDQTLLYKTKMKLALMF